VADFQLRGIESGIVDRVKTIARERNWSINDVMLHLLRQALGLVEPDAQPAKLPGDIAALPGTLAQDESAALLEAIKAFENLPQDNSPFRLAGRETE
jgi:hypothetical protein